MARRVLEEELRAKHCIEWQPMGPVKSVKMVKELKLHKTFRGVYSLQFNFSGDILAVGYGSGGIQLFDSSGNLLKELRSCRQGGHSVMALRFHPKQPTILYAATTEGSIHSFDCDTGEQLAHIEGKIDIKSLSGRYASQSVAGLLPSPGDIHFTSGWSETNDVKCSSRGHSIGLTNCRKGNPQNANLDLSKSGNEINCLDFCVDGFNFATGGKDLNVRVYETKTNKLVTEFKGYSNRRSHEQNMVSNTMRVFSLKFHPDNQYIFLTGGWDNHIKIWDVRANDGIKRNIRGPHICGDAIDMQESTILSGQWTALHALQEYNYTSGDVVRELKYPHDDGAFLYCAQYCNKDLVVAGGSGTCSAEFINISTNSHVGGFKLGAPVQAIDTTKFGRVAAIGGATSSLIILNLSD